MKCLNELLGAAAFIAATANAQSSTAPLITSIYFPQLPLPSLVASVINADAAATTYSVSWFCRANRTNCASDPNYTITQSGTTVVKGEQNQPTVSMTYSCDMHGTTSADCDRSASMAGVGVETYVFAESGRPLAFSNMTITAGLEKLTAVPSAVVATTTTGTSTGRSSAATSSGTATTSRPANAGSQKTWPSGGMAVVLGFFSVLLL